MRCARAVVLLVLAALGGPAAAGGGGGTTPRLDLRASPRSAFPPVTVLVTGQLVGGDDVEEYYCPALEWDWGDGGRSAQESDCPPFDADTKMARRFTSRHAYHEPGYYEIRLTLRRGSRHVAVGVVTVSVGVAEDQAVTALASLR
jgi:hypothetical protein